MKKSFLKTTVFALIALLVFPLAACGGGNTDSGGNNPPDDTPKLSVVQLLDKAQGYFNEANTSISNAAVGIGDQYAETIAPMSLAVKPLADKEGGDETPTSGPTLDDLEGYVLVGIMSEQIWRYFGATEYYTAEDFSKLENPEAFADLIGQVKHEGEFTALSRYFKELDTLLSQQDEDAVVEQKVIYDGAFEIPTYYSKSGDSYIVSTPFPRQFIDASPNLTPAQKNEVVARRETSYTSDGTSITTSGRWVKESNKALPENLKHDSGGFNNFATIAASENKASFEKYTLDEDGNKSVTQRIVLIKTATDYYVQMYSQSFEPCGYGSPGFVEGLSERWYEYFDRMNQEEKHEVLPNEPYAIARFNNAGTEGTVKSFRNYSRDAGGANSNGYAQYEKGKYPLPQSWFTAFDASSIFNDIDAMDGKWLSQKQLCLCTFNFHGLSVQVL